MGMTRLALQRQSNREHLVSADYHDTTVLSPEVTQKETYQEKQTEPVEEHAFSRPRSTRRLTMAYFLDEPWHHGIMLANRKEGLEFWIWIGLDCICVYFSHTILS